MNQKLVLLKMALVISESLRSIINSFGIAKAAFFCRENMSASVDYLESKEKIFGEKSARKIYEEIKNNHSWKPIDFRFSHSPNGSTCLAILLAIYIIVSI